MINVSLEFIMSSKFLRARITRLHDFDSRLRVLEAMRLSSRSASTRENRRCNFAHTQPEETRRWLRRTEAFPPPSNERGLKARGASAADVGGCALVHVHRERHVPRSRVRPQPHLGISARSGVNSVSDEYYTGECRAYQNVIHSLLSFKRE